MQQLLSKFFKNMKQISYKIIIIFALASVLVSCEEKHTEVIPELEVSSYAVTLPSEVSSVPFYIKAYTNWNIALSANWCQHGRGNLDECFDLVASNFWSSLSAYSGKASNEVEIIVSALEDNPTYFRRMYGFKITAGNLSENVYVTQLGKPYLEIEQTHYEIEAAPSYYEFEIMVKIYDDFFKVTSSAEWISNSGHGLTGGVDMSPLQYRVRFAIEKNTSPNPRAAILTFTQGNLTKMVTVRQAGAEQIL